MIIGLNGERLLIENSAGPEKYSYNLFSAIAKEDNKNKYIVYFNSKPSEKYWLELSNSNPNFSYKVIKKTLSWTQFDLALDLIKDPVDIFFTAVHTMPIFRHPKTKYVGMIHGLEYTYSKGYKNPIRKFFLNGPVEYTVKHSQHVIVPSKATKDAILSKKWIQETKITVVNEGISDHFCRSNEEEIRKTKQKYNINESPYFLFVSTIQPRKNIPNMVEAFSMISQLYPDIKLIIAGKKGWDYEESINSPKKFNVEDKVTFIGRAPDEDMPALFSGALGHINVSFEEGFGLPLLEAFGCGTPSVVSDIPSYHEVGENLVIYVDPSNPKDIKEGIEKLLQNPLNTQLLIQRSRNFTWQKSAQKTILVFENLIKNF